MPRKPKIDPQPATERRVGRPKVDDPRSIENRTHKMLPEDHDRLVEWIAADYSAATIVRWAAQENWPISERLVAYYRDKHADIIAAQREQRLTGAINRGLSQKAERIARLCDHADKLEPLKWVYNPKTGLNYNPIACREWRETLVEIALEMGDRDNRTSLALEREVEALIDRLDNAFDRETYARILTIAKNGGAANGRY